MVGVFVTSKWIFSISCVGQACVLRMRYGSSVKEFACAWVCVCVVRVNQPLGVYLTGRGEQLFHNVRISCFCLFFKTIGVDFCSF